MILLMYRRIIAMTLILLLALSAAGCNGTNTDETNPTDANTDTLPIEETTEPIPGLEDYDGDVNMDDSPDDVTESTEPTTGETEAPTEGKDDPVEGTTEPTEATDPTESTETPESTEPSESTTPAEGDNQGGSTVTAYENYMNMSGEEQLAFMQSFESMEAFFAWLNAAKAEYEAQNPGIDVGDGNIDLGGGN